MNNHLQQLKTQIHSLCLDTLQAKLQEAKDSLKELKEAAQQDTKSSMGDKYETGPALIQQEKDKINTQITEIIKMQEVMHRIDSKYKNPKIRLGSLIEANTGYYYLSIGLGKISWEAVTCFCISPASPLGQALIGHLSGDDVLFRNQIIKIKSVA